MKSVILPVAILAMPALVFAQTPAATQPAPPAFFAKQGIKVLSYQKGAGGLNVWQVQRGSTKTVLYTSPDNKVLMSAVLWDAATGSNISDGYITQDMLVTPTDAAALTGTPQATPEIIPTGSPTKMSEAIKGVASLTGVKEGNASADKTLYIMFDPRCKYCHNVYQKTRDFVKAGGTIKWIPTTVLGDSAGGASLVADVLQASNQRGAMAAVMGNARPSSSTKPSDATRKAIAENEAYFFAAFEKNKGAGMAGVPVAFFETKNGSPQMVGGVDDDVLLAKIFSDIKK